MRVQVYEQLMAMQRSRRDVLKGAAGAAALAASSSVLSSTPSFAEDSIVSQIMKIPGAGNGSPTDADWQKVGALCLGPTKANVKPGEFAGVEFSFMGLNNQNLHNFLFRGFLTPWEAYTGAKIKWIDLAQGDYNARLQQSIATGTVDFDIIEMGAPFEGDMGVKDLLSEMPDWVKTQIDFDDYVNYLKPPVGTWNGKIHRVTIDSDCHTHELPHRCLLRSGPGEAVEGLGRTGRVGTAEDLAAGAGDHQIPQGQEVQGQGCLRLPRSAQALGRFRLLFPRQPRHGLREISRREKLAVRRKLQAARSTARPSCARSRTWSTPCRHEPPDQINADGNTTAFQQFVHRDGFAPRMVGRHRHIRENERHRDDRRRARFRHPARFGRRLQFPQRRQWEKLASGPNQAPNMAYLGWGIYVMKTVDADPKRQKAAWSAAAHLGGKDLSMWTAAYPSGFQPYRKSHTNLDLWALAGYDKKYIGAYMDSQSTSYNHPNSAIEPRIPGIFQYYSIAEDELSKVYAGKETAQQGADNVAAAWEKLTDKLGRENQVKYYRISMGLT